MKNTINTLKEMRMRLKSEMTSAPNIECRYIADDYQKALKKSINIMSLIEDVNKIMDIIPNTPMCQNEKLRLIHNYITISNNIINNTETPIDVYDDILDTVKSIKWSIDHSPLILTYEHHHELNNYINHIGEYILYRRLDNIYTHIVNAMKDTEILYKGGYHEDKMSILKMIKCYNSDNRIPKNVLSKMYNFIEFLKSITLDTTIIENMNFCINEITNIDKNYSEYFDNTTKKYSNIRTEGLGNMDLNKDTKNNNIRTEGLGNMDERQLDFDGDTILKIECDNPINATKIVIGFDNIDILSNIKFVNEFSTLNSALPIVYAMLKNGCNCKIDNSETNSELYFIGNARDIDKYYELCDGLVYIHSCLVVTELKRADNNITYKLLHSIQSI